MPMIKETESHIVLQMTDDAGEHYEVGYPKSTGYRVNNVMALSAESEQIAEGEVEALGEHGGSGNLRWVPSAKESYTSEDAKKLGVVRGNVTEGGQMFQYRINFVNDRGWSFAFEDESGDIYRCTTWKDGYHYIDYNSGKPAIVNVR